MIYNENLFFYVSSEGNDNWSGRMPQPNKEQNDGPFATLGKAVEESRKYGSGIRRKIIIRGGNYYDVSVELRTEDSGLAIEAMPGERPILYGGIKITGWKKEAGKDCWFAELPGILRESRNLRLLVVNGRLRKRSRLPEKGTFEHLTEFNVDWMSTGEGGWKRKPTEEELTTLKYKEENLGPWLDINNAELTVYHKWDESLAGISFHDAKNHILKLSNPCGHPPGSFKCRKYVVWNVREGMTEPGQWYHDRTLGRVVYWPIPGETMENVEVIVPTRFNVIKITGKVRDITVKGLTIAVTSTPLIAAGFAAAEMPGAVQGFDDMKNCSFSGITIKNTGGYGIKLEGYCESVTIEGCEISHTGAGGILFRNSMKDNGRNEAGTAAQCPLPGLTEEQPTSAIINNHVHHIGLICSSATAISAYYCNIMHNEISDTPYTGICYGPPTVTSHDRCANVCIGHNIISRVMQVLNDGAAIYVTFTSNGIVRGNIIRDIEQSGESDSIRNAIYLDEQTKGWVVESNMVINCSHPIFNHLACANIIRNNVLVCDSYLKMNFIRCQNYKVERNIVYSKGKIVLAGNPGAVVLFGNNLLYSLAGEYEEHYINDRYQHYHTIDLVLRDGTIKADPLFENTACGNYALKPNSPAFKLGIAKVDIKKSGN